MLPCTSALPSSTSICKFISDHTLLSMLETKCNSMRDLHRLHSQLIKTGLARDHIAISRVLAFCATSPNGDLNYAMRLFFHHHQPNAFMYNTLIRGLSHSSTPHLAISLFLDMLHSPIPPQRLTFPSLFIACSHLGLAAHCGAQLHGMAFKLGHASDPYVRNSMLSMYANCGCISMSSRLFDECSSFDVVCWNSMITGLAKNGQIDKSRYLFDEMPMRNLVSWSAMISGYVRSGRNDEALHLFYRMQEEGLNPNANILVSLLGACGSLGALDQGEWIHQYIRRNDEFVLDPIVTTAIIDMYCKCGSINKALEVFENSSTKGLSSWNSMIHGLAMHGHSEAATRLFSRLESSNLRPDDVTFLNILTSCSHAGSVDEAWHYLSLMIDEYGIEPGTEHYGCMVDVLGRAGLIEEAEELMRRMPMEPDSVMWGSLLSAGRVYGDDDASRRAGRQVIQLDHLDSGGYVVLSNVFAGAGDVGNANEARTRMKERGVRKETGCSMIEVNGVAHEFVAGGVLHPEAEQVYETLERLALELRRQYNVELGILDTLE
ncbi:pentatricopeptide repeat-containing protein At2g42920, chloroplastic-like [Musa acuminata AAA Group]|uniref:pentatricopeptide repeat-containing protein At2g42920, chloroplastic-like n=1 Tax=Musa acuminata AAA Group TaxID=214697 RepID=UPI0031D1D54E